GFKPFGDPFMFVILEGEVLQKMKNRIQKKLHVPDEEFAKMDIRLLFSNKCGNLHKKGRGKRMYLGLEHGRQSWKEESRAPALNTSKVQLAAAHC
ncbi:predicted protein, partial [Arabidopsis lyrata subsp. lyrata]